MEGKKKTPFGYVSNAVFKDLRKGGWFAARDKAHIVENYRRFFGDHWIEAAEPFVRSFGGLKFNGDLWVWVEPIWDQDLVILEERIAKIVGSRVLPVATSSCMSEGCVVWIDEVGRFYAASGDGMIFIANGIGGLLEALLRESTPEEPSPEVRDLLINGYYWDEE